MGVKHVWRLSAIGVAFSVGTASVFLPNASASAQHIAANSHAGPVSVKRVTVHATNEPVRAVLERIARQAGLKPSYDVELVPASARVSVQLEQVPVDQAFRHALQGMPLVAQVQVSGNVLILPAPVSYVDGVIIGKVVNEKTKTPVRGATILLDEQTAGVSTGDNGEFRISTGVGEHVLHIRALGMVKQTRRVTVADGQTVTVEIVLAPSASVLDEVVVTGTVVATERKAIPNAITVVTAEEIERRGITRIDDLFRGVVPGVLALDIGTGRYAGHGVGATNDVVGQMVSSSVISRGASVATPYATANPLKTYVDGVELLDPTYLGTIDPKSIEKIEVITGPQASTIYGSGAMGGVLQVFTKRGAATERTDYSLRVQYGILQNNLSTGRTPQHRHVASVNGTNGPGFSYALTASHDYTGQWQPDLFNRQYAGSVGLNYRQGPLVVNGSLSMSGGVNGTSGANDVRNSPMDKLLKQTGVKVVIGIGQYISQRISRSSSQTVSANLDYQATPFWQHHVVLGRNQNDFALDPQSPVFYRDFDSLYRRAETNGKRTTASYNTTLLVKTGVMSSSITLGFNGSLGDRTQIIGCFPTSNATTFVECNTGLYNGDLEVTKPVGDRNWGGFGTAQVGLFDQLYVTFGLRGERNPNYGQSHIVDWTPRSGIAYSFSLSQLTLKLRTAYGSATRPPAPDMRDAWYSGSAFSTPSRFIGRFANPELTPEYSKGPEFGLEMYYGNIGSVTINHYRQRITDLIQNVPVDSIWIMEGSFGYWYRQNQYLNAATVKQIGWEATGNVSLGPVTLSGTYSWNDSRIEKSRLSWAAPGTSFYAIPTHTGNMTIGYALGGTNVLVSTNYIGSSPNGPFSDCCDPYATGSYRLQMYVPRYAGRVNPPNAAYTKSDLILSHRITSRIDASLTMQNLTNNFDSDADAGFPSLGRQTLFGITIRGGR